MVEWNVLETHMIQLPDRVAKQLGSRAVVPYVVWSAATIGAAIDLSTKLGSNVTRSSDIHCSRLNGRADEVSSSRPKKWFTTVPLLSSNRTRDF
jgi:hypothetical protein